VHRLQGGEVFQAHLRGAVGADLGAGVRSAQFDIGAGNPGHADEVVGPGPERRERGGIGHIAAGGQTHSGGDQLLFGDEHLEELLRVRVHEAVRAGGVADLGVQGDDVGSHTNRGQRVAIGGPGRDRGASLVAGQDDRRCLARGDRACWGGWRWGDKQIARSAQCGHGGLGQLERKWFAVPAVAVFDLGDAPAFDGFGEHNCRGVRFTGGAECLVDLGQIVAVDDDRVAAEVVAVRCAIVITGLLEFVVCRLSSREPANAAASLQHRRVSVMREDSGRCDARTGSEDR
jgi:hypothetical protein